MAKVIMVQGTASTVGKSIITAALCRIFFRDGYSVAPFKSQNMALNSFITEEGHEMGRAQVVQAEACGIKPSSLMNPILIKPTSDARAQIIINGRVYKNLDAMEYGNYKTEAKAIVKEAFLGLSEKFDIIVIEGAGSPAEINLKENDIVNMGMAEIADSPVLLVGDIDKGGVFAQLAGTMQLLEEHEKSRVKGTIINKFRGDVELLKPGLCMIEDIIKIPVLGVIPYMDLNIDDEDSVTDRFKKSNSSGEINIDVIQLPYLSNFTDFNVFDIYDDVNLRFVARDHEIGDPDIIIIPGSKNTIADMEFIRHEQLDRKIIDHYKKGKLLVGICAGLQMLGKSIEDPYGLEGHANKIDGLGIIDIKTVIEKDKVTKQVKGTVTGESGFLRGLKGKVIEGYEIHMGRSSGKIKENTFIDTENGETGILHDNIMGTYIHGIFDNSEFTRGLLNNLREDRGLPVMSGNISYGDFKEQEYDRLAQTVRQNLNMKAVYGILDGKEVK
ncbi:cobyric acid synthase [Spirochaetota bacterium]